MPEASVRADSDPCPLCAARRAEIITEVAYAEIWTWLEEIRGTMVSDEVRVTNTPEPVTTLVECEECGLRYFNPLHPGDSLFYAQVMNAVPYEGSRWEFGVVGGRLGAQDRVVDFGCGEGAFLEAVRARVAEVVGVDHNPEAALKAATSGIHISTDAFRDFAAAHRGHFDVACGFQVVEHVAVVDELLGPMLDCLRRPGRLFLSLPNRERFPAMPLDPLDHPPHHLSRWSSAQLGDLAERWGLELIGIDFEEPDFSTATLATRDRWARRLASGTAEPGRLAALVAKVVTKLTLSEYRYRQLAHRGAFTDRGVFGHTMLAEFRVA